MALKKIPDLIIDQALTAWQSGDRERNTTATLVRGFLQRFEQRYPGHTVELRVPPFGVIQCFEGASHTRGTPPNVVELPPESFIQIFLGEEDWNGLQTTGRLTASGSRSDLSQYFPFNRAKPTDSSP